MLYFLQQHLYYSENLFVLLDVFLYKIKMTPIVKTRHFLKLTFSDKNRLAAFHSFILDKGK